MGHLETRARGRAGEREKGGGFLVGNNRHGVVLLLGPICMLPIGNRSQSRLSQARAEAGLRAH